MDISLRNISKSDYIYCIYAVMFINIGYIHFCVMSSGPYRKVSIPKEIVDIAEKLAQDKRLGYTSTSDLVRDAVRRLICTLKAKQDILDHNEGDDKR